jgi:hypothetical protein
MGSTSREGGRGGHNGAPVTFYPGAASPNKSAGQLGTPSKSKPSPSPSPLPPLIEYHVTYNADKQYQYFVLKLNIILKGMI